MLLVRRRRHAGGEHRAQKSELDKLRHAVTNDTSELVEALCGRMWPLRMILAFTEHVSTRITANPKRGASASPAIGEPPSSWDASDR